MAAKKTPKIQTEAPEILTPDEELQRAIADAKGSFVLADRLKESLTVRSGRVTVIIDTEAYDELLENQNAVAEMEARISIGRTAINEDHPDKALLEPPTVAMEAMLEKVLVKQVPLKERVGKGVLTYHLRSIPDDAMRVCQRGAMKALGSADTSKQEVRDRYEQDLMARVLKDSCVAVIDHEGAVGYIRKVSEARDALRIHSSQKMLLVDEINRVNAEGFRINKEIDDPGF